MKNNRLAVTRGPVLFLEVGRGEYLFVPRVLEDEGASYCWMVMETPACVDCPAVEATKAASPFGSEGTLTLSW